MAWGKRTEADHLQECLAEWRLNLAKIEGKCKALEEALENEKKKHNKEVSSIMVKGEKERQSMVGSILIGLFKVSGRRWPLS